MEFKLRGPPGVGVKLHDEKAAVLQQLDASECRTEFDTKVAPVPGFRKRGGHPPGGVAKKTDRRYPGEKPGLHENEL